MLVNYGFTWLPETQKIIDNINNYLKNPTMFDSIKEKMLNAVEFGKQKMKDASKHVQDKVKQKVKQKMNQKLIEAVLPSKYI